uniref:Uncharacterized protein n=1 Tax=Anguilla anguilla TaxID=7936 RepID=A0A0E9Q6F4_ANGAN
MHTHTHTHTCVAWILHTIRNQLCMGY